MQIPCNGHVCFLLNMSARHIHAHNQFHDHHFSPRAPISEYFKEVPGLPAKVLQLLAGPRAVLKGRLNMKWQLCRSILLCIMPFAPYTTQFWFQFCQTFTCTLSGILVHHSSNLFIQRHILVVLWWLAALPTL